MIKEILKDYSILYAEDHQGTQQVVVGYLKRFFNEVYIANDGLEALNIYKKHNPSVLMLDIDMPQIDGLEVARLVREENSEIPIFILTAYTNTDKLIQATELNLCKYLVKPIEPKDFRSALEKVSKKFQKRTTNFFKIDENYKWDMDNKQLLHKNSQIILSEKEELLLMLFIENKENCVTYEDIMVHLWKDSFEIDISIESVKQQVKLLRTKIPKNCIKNVYGRGWKLD